MKTNAVSKTYDGRTVLQMPAVDLAADTVHVVLGSNGSGKSTWAKILAGVLAADGGTMPLTEPCRVGYLPQKAYAFRMSMEKNLRIAANDREREDRLLAQLHLTELRKAPANRLSGGESARMALARVLMKPFDLLILDEPSAAMDMESTMLAEKAILDYKKETGAAVLLITHSIRQARRVGDGLFFLKNGMPVETGPCKEHLDAPGTKELKEFLEFYGG